jgi:hypothetical protein
MTWIPSRISYPKSGISDYRDPRVAGILLPTIRTQRIIQSYRLTFLRADPVYSGLRADQQIRWPPEVPNGHDEKDSFPVIAFDGKKIVQLDEE